MIKVEVIENFTLEDYNKLKNVKKVISRKENEFGARDTFECDEKMVDYLTGNNPLNKVVVKVIEVVPEKIKDISPKDTKEESENIIPLDKEKCEEIAEKLLKHVNTSKKKKNKK